MKKILLLLDDFDMKGCAIKVDNKINDKMNCLGELMSVQQSHNKHTRSERQKQV